MSSSIATTNGIPQEGNGRISSKLVLTMVGCLCASCSLRPCSRSWAHVGPTPIPGPYLAPIASGFRCSRHRLHPRRTQVLLRPPSLGRQRVAPVLPRLATRPHPLASHTPGLPRRLPPRLPMRAMLEARRHGRRSLPPCVARVVILLAAAPVSPGCAFPSAVFSSPSQWADVMGSPFRFCCFFRAPACQRSRYPGHPSYACPSPSPVVPLYVPRPCRGSRSPLSPVLEAIPHARVRVYVYVLPLPLGPPFPPRPLCANSDDRRSPLRLRVSYPDKKNTNRDRASALL